MTRNGHADGSTRHAPRLYAEGKLAQVETTFMTNDSIEGQLTIAVAAAHDAGPWFWQYHNARAQPLLNKSKDNPR